MMATILHMLEIMGWLGIVLGALIIVNTTTGTLINVWSKGETFSTEKMIKGLLKSLMFYLSAVLLSTAFTILPFINEKINTNFGVIVLPDEVLSSLSGLAVLAIVITAIIQQGKKAISGVIEMANITLKIEDEK